jgi:predicted  nucleic acid-binding Zn-ribbon protein
MTQGPSDGREAMAQSDGMFSQREQRVALLSRASQAVRRAQATAQDAGKVRAASEDVTLTTLETRALIEAEREAMKKLEADVRRFADALRTEGTPPEVAVRRLKATVDPVVYSAREHDAADVEWRRAVAGDVVRWFVEAYYAA